MGIRLSAPSAELMTTPWGTFLATTLSEHLKILKREEGGGEGGRESKGGGGEEGKGGKGKGGKERVGGGGGEGGERGRKKKNIHKQDLQKKTI